MQSSSTIFASKCTALLSYTVISLQKQTGSGLLQVHFKNIKTLCYRVCLRACVLENFTFNWAFWQRLPALYFKGAKCCTLLCFKNVISLNKYPVLHTKNVQVNFHLQCYYFHLRLSASQIKPHNSQSAITLRASVCWANGQEKRRRKKATQRQGML